MPLFHSEVYDAFREIGVSHEKAAAAATALYASRPASPSLPLWPLPVWPWVVMAVVMAGCLLFAGYLICAHGQFQEQAARTRALIERLHPVPQP